MLEKSFIKEKVNEMIKEKGYDNRITPLLSAFFIAASEKYNYTEDELTRDIETYKSRVNNISFYNIGIDKYIYDYGKELVYDRELVEELNRGNIERFIKTIIKSTAVITKGNAYKSGENIIQMSSIANLYEYSDNLSKNINNMIANVLEVKPEEVPQMREFISERMQQTNREEDPKGYNYLNETSIILTEIDRRIEDIEKGSDVREAYKSIYALLTLNYRNRIVFYGKGNEDSVRNYTQLLDNFDQLKNLFNIEDKELDSVSADGKSWHLKVNEFLKELEESFKDFEKPNIYKEENGKRPVYFDREQIIEEQAEKNSEVDNSITEEQIKQKVSELIEIKKYPQEFETVLQEFFKRSVDEFSWDRETLEKKIENFSRNVNSFEYSREKEYNDGVHTIAFFSALEKKIVINPIAMTLSNLELASTFMHEIKHATDLTVRDSHTTYEDSFKKEVKYRRN